MQEFNRQNITPINIEDEMQQSYIDYSMSVIVMRALPDVRDGLKPVHRRIIFSMYTEGLAHNKQHRKCARVVGDFRAGRHTAADPQALPRGASEGVEPARASQAVERAAIHDRPRKSSRHRCAHRRDGARAAGRHRSKIAGYAPGSVEAK